MKRKNNIFFSAFVLIATFAFMLSPLGVYAASSLANQSEVTESQCTSQGGVVKTNYYMFLTAAKVGENIDSGNYISLFENPDDPSTPLTEKSLTTAKTFDLGFVSEDDKLINHGTMQINRSTTDNGTTSWSTSTFYTHFLAAKANSKEVVVDGNNSYASAAVWYDETGQETSRATSLSTNVEENVAATYDQDSNINASLVTIKKDETGQFKITRRYTQAAFKTATGTVDGHIYHPALYYVQYCHIPEATPTSDGFKVEYDPNGGTSAPDKQDSPDGSPVNISDGKPNRNGYTFLGWSTDKNATEPDSRYAAGKSYAGPNDLYLYAVWSPKTGVSDYLMATAIVAGVAGLGLFISRRKRLFKQI